MRLQQKVYFSLVSAILVPLVISTWLFSSSLTNFLKDKLESSELPTALSEVRNAIELELSGPIEASKAIATNTLVKQWLVDGEPQGKLQQYTDYLRANKESNSGITAFIVSGESQNYYTHGGLVRQISRAEDNWFYDFIKSDKEFELSMDVDKTLGTAAVFINYAIKVNNRSVAVGGIGRSLDSMAELISEYQIAETGLVYLVNSQGVIQLHPNKNLIGQQAPISNLNNSGYQTIEIQQQDFIVASQKLKSLNWYIVAEIPESELLGAVDSAVYQNIFMGVMIAIIGFVLVRLLAKQIFSPLRWIHKAVADLNENDGDLTARIRVKEENEVGELAQQINLFLEQLHAMFSNVSTATDKVKNLVDSVADKVTYSNGLADKQSHSTQVVAAAVNEMESTVRQISESASNASELASQAEHRSNSGSDYVQHTVRHMNQLEHSMTGAVSTVKELSDEIQSITHVLDVIKGISEQTNLLALNAAIEAARAGEQGRGFAVVADEVRTLAQRTAESTEEINLMITNLKSKASNAVSAIEKGSQGTESASVRLGKTGQTFTTVSSEIVTLTEMNNQVAMSTKEQTSATEEINQNIVLISDTAHETKEKMDAVAGLCKELDNNANELVSEISKFKL